MIEHDYLPTAIDDVSVAEEDVLQKYAVNYEKSLLPILNTAKNLVRTKLQDFAQSPDFAAKMKLAFSQDIDIFELQEKWATGIINFPVIEICPIVEIGQVWGAFSRSTEKIYLAQELLEHQSLDQIVSVLIEEYGHFIDAQINRVDIPGDEGELFARFLQGGEISVEDLHDIKYEDDLVRVNLDGKLAEVEQVAYTEIDMAANGLNDFVNTTSGRNYKVIGTSGDNTILVNSGYDLVYGRGGNDTIAGGISDDAVYGGGGDDIVTGNDGNDVLDGGGGKDQIAGGRGDDIYRVSLGSGSGGTIINDLGNHTNPSGTVVGGGLDTLLIYEEPFQENDVEDASYKPKENYQTIVSVEFDVLEEGLVGSQRDGTTLIIDLNQDGVINQTQDLSILNFFNEDGSPGLGYIENILGQSETIKIDGKLGDIIKVDLNQELEEQLNKDFSDFDLSSGNLKLQSETAKNEQGEIVGEVAKVDNWEQELSNGILYFVPKVDGIPLRFEEPHSDAGLDTSTLILVDDDGTGELEIQFEITDGFSTTGEGNEVTFNGQQSSKLDIYRQEQRLAYLGFPQKSGNPLSIDGQSASSELGWAISLFDAAALNKDKLKIIDQLSQKSQIYLNSNNAPRWNELRNDSISNLSIKDGNTQKERWGTNWSFTLVKSAVSGFSSRKILTAASLISGGDTPSHKTHENGQDIDIDTPGKETQNYEPEGKYFFKEFKFEDTWYVASNSSTPGSKKVIVKNSSGQYVSANPTSANLANAVRGKQLFDNETLLSKVASLLQDNDKNDYDLAQVRNLITTFLNTSVDGITVSRVFFNDPRTWDLGVKFSAGHNGHVHFDVLGPPVVANFSPQGLNNVDDRPTAEANSRQKSIASLNNLDPLFNVPTTDPVARDLRKDILVGGLDEDHFISRSDSDTFILRSLRDSLLFNFGIIDDYTKRDMINAPDSILPVKLRDSIGRITSLSKANLSSLLTEKTFAANNAVAFNVKDRPGIFVACNDSTSGFKSNSDSILYCQDYHFSSSNPLSII